VDVLDRNYDKEGEKKAEREREKKTITKLRVAGFLNSPPPRIVLPPGE